MKDQMYVSKWVKDKAKKPEFVRNHRWGWEADTDMGMFYVEARGGEQYFAFHLSTMLHNCKSPYMKLGDAIKRCEDAYHQLKWGDRM